MLPAKPTLSFISLMIFVSFAAFAVTLPLSLLPEIAQAFQVSPSSSEGVISWCLAGYAVAQLVYGPLANHMGRRHALLLGSGIALLSGIVGVLAVLGHCFWLYLVARFGDGLGAGAGLIIAMILIKDAHEPMMARKVFSRVVLTFSFVPFVAIASGGILGKYAGWSWVNILLLVYDVLMVFLSIRLVETFPKVQRTAVSVRGLLHAYRHVLSQRMYLTFGLTFALISAVNYIFNGIAPLWVEGVLNVSPQAYGYLSVLPGIGLFIGAYVSQAFAHKIKAYPLIMMGLWILVAATGGLALCFWIHCVNMVLFYAMAILLFVGQAIVAANAGMEALSYVTDHANASSVMNAFSLLAGSVMVSVTGHLFAIHPLWFPVVLLLMGLISVVLMLNQVIHVAIKGI